MARSVKQLKGIRGADFGYKTNNQRYVTYSIGNIVNNTEMTL